MGTKKSIFQNASTAPKVLAVFKPKMYSYIQIKQKQSGKIIQKVSTALNVIAEFETNNQNIIQKKNEKEDVKPIKTIIHGLTRGRGIGRGFVPVTANFWVEK